jgi:hypothetical protein
MIDIVVYVNKQDSGSVCSIFKNLSVAIQACRIALIFLKPQRSYARMGY